MRVLYNEGRVCGLSSYELYVRQSLSIDPNATILTESEWLAANVYSGNAMVLRVAEGTDVGYHDYILPENCSLCGNSTLYGSIFEGAAVWDENGNWATSINSYGRLISNTAQIHPETPGEPEDVPATDTPGVIPADYKLQCQNYINITSALMIQPGEWNGSIVYPELLTEDGENLLTEDDEILLGEAENTGYCKSLVADFTKRGFVRLAISKKLTSDVYILITGMSSKIFTAIYSLSDESAGSPWDGDFLGPQVFPWGSKIQLTVTTDVIYTLFNN